MKVLTNQLNGNAKIKFTLALCTVLAMTGVSVNAADYKDKDTSDKNSTKATSRATSLSKSNQKFIQDAARAGMMEIHMGKLGVEKGQNPQLKQFSQKLIDDHSKANAQLRQLAASKGLSLPQPREGITATDPSVTGIEAVGAPNAATGISIGSSGAVEHNESDARAEMRKLHGLAGTDFDRAFAKMSVKSHEKAVKEFERAAGECDDSDVKVFAAKTLPTLREHLATSRNLESQIGNPGASSAEVGIDSRVESSGKK